MLARFRERGDVVSLGLGERQNTGGGRIHQAPKRETRLDSCYGGWPAGFAGRCINKLVSVLD